PPQTGPGPRSAAADQGPPSPCPRARRRPSPGRAGCCPVGTTRWVPSLTPPVPTIQVEWVRAAFVRQPPLLGATTEKALYVSYAPSKSDRPMAGVRAL